MKKFFTLIAMALLTVGVNAQTITFEEHKDKKGDQKDADQNVTNHADNLEYTFDDFTAVFDGGTKSKISEKSLTFALATATTDAERESFKYQYCPGGGVTKTTGERSITFTFKKAGTLTIYPRSADKNATDRTLTVQQGEQKLLDAAVVSDNDQVTIGETPYYKAFAVKVAAGTVNVLTSAAINFSAFKFVAESGQGETNPENPENPEDATTVGTLWTFDDAAAEYTALTNYNNLWIHANTGNHAVKKVEGAGEATLESGSVVSVANYLDIPSNSDTAIPNALAKRRKADNTASLGEYLAFDVEKAGTAYVLIRTKDATEGRVMRMNFQLDEDNTFTQVEKPAAKELTEIKLEATGAGTFFIYGTVAVRVFAVNFVPKENTTPETDGISTVKDVKTAGKWYNMQGQQVAAPGKGLFIMNGRKYMVK